MQAIQYVTTQAFRLRPYELFPCGSVPTASKEICVQEAAEPGDLLGFGVALTGSSCYELSTMAPEARKAFLEDIYTQKGLGLSVGRLTVGSCDYSAELYSYDDGPEDLPLENFSVKRDERYIIPMVKEALAANPDLYLFASPWSPPGWMKTGGSMCGGYMRDRYVDCYAQYFVKFLKAYAQHGIPVQAVTPQNEPETDTDGRYPGCRWHPETEAAFILALRKALDEAGLDTGIWMFDHNFDGWRRVQWMLETYPELMQASGTAAFHYYNMCVENLDALRETHPQLALHFTEGGPRLYDHYDTDFCKWSMMIAKALNHGCRSFTGWNLMLDETGGPNIGPFFCGGLVTLNSQTGELSYSGQYKALAHFSRFLQRGARIHASHIRADGMLMSTFPDVGMPMTSFAAENPDGSRVLVAVNPNDTKRQAYCRVDGQIWYIELLPDSVSTIVFK